MIRSLRERIALYLTGEITLAHYHDAVADTHQPRNLGRRIMITALPCCTSLSSSR